MAVVAAWVVFEAKPEEETVTRKPKRAARSNVWLNSGSSA